ncbi:MAG: hypothetical protein PHZ13_10980 [bacterium]|nr:hypothetical protein [bacterium]
MRVGNRRRERNTHGKSGGGNRWERCGASGANGRGSLARSMRVGCRQRESRSEHCINAEVQNRESDAM